jgi:hypothetical protein
MVVHAYNPRDRKDHSLRATISTNEPGVVVDTYNLSYMGGVSRRIVNQANTDKKF